MISQSSRRGEGDHLEVALPVVSILMPAYNARAYIGQAVASVRHQLFREWELLVADDGSTDGTLDEARRAAEGDTRVICIPGVTNEGIGRARAKALALARGRLVALMDSDDVAEANWLEARVDQLDANPRLVAVSGSKKLMDENGALLGRTWEEASPDALAWGLLFGNPVSQPSAVLRRDAVARAGGYGSERFLEDWNLFSRLSREGEIAQTDDLLVRYRVRAASASRTMGRDRELLGDLVERIIAMNLCRLVDSVHSKGSGWTLFRGRAPVPVDEADLRRAVAIVLDALRAFRRVRLLADPPGVAAAALRDIANVLRCGTWSPWITLSAIRGIGRSLGICAFLHPAAAREAAVLLALPLTPTWRRRVRNGSF